MDPSSFLILANTALILSDINDAVKDEAITIDMVINDDFVAELWNNGECDGGRE